MCYKQSIFVLLGMLAGSPLLAQEGSGEPPNPCTIEPIFHCVQTMDDGVVIGHFGYRCFCPESDKPVEDVYISIGDDNYFAPGLVDRGQAKVFIPGEHVDEFEVDFSAEEVTNGKEIGWTVLNNEARVNFSTTEDASLDCDNLPY
jgi:hypothetical protein